MSHNPHPSLKPTTMSSLGKDDTWLHHVVHTTKDRYDAPLANLRKKVGLKYTCVLRQAVPPQAVWHRLGWHPKIPKEGPWVWLAGLKVVKAKRQEKWLEGANGVMMWGLQPLEFYQSPSGDEDDIQGSVGGDGPTVISRKS